MHIRPLRPKSDLLSSCREDGKLHCRCKEALWCDGGSCYWGVVRVTRVLQYCSTAVESNRLYKSVSLMCISCCQPFVVNLQNVLPASTSVETNCGSVTLKERPEMRGSCYNGETRYVQ
jgi:hypothetical protein